MKKLGFVVLLVLSALLFAGCQLIGKHSVLVEVIGLENEVLFEKTIRYDSETELNYVEILDDAIELEYTMSAYGAFITGVGGIYPPEQGKTYNYWFSILIDEETSLTGLDAVELKDKTKITFKISTMLDEIELKVDQVIRLFLEDHLDRYINDTEMDYGVALAISKLKSLGYDVPEMSSLTLNHPELFRDTISNAYKTAVIEEVLNLDSTQTLNYLENATAANLYEAVSQLLGLTLLESKHQKINDVIDMIISDTPEFMDADYAGMSLQALSFYKDRVGVSTYMDQMILYIKEQLSASGVSAWGNANAASTAQVIIGLVSIDLNPRDDVFTVGNNDLIMALFIYELQGAFKYLESDQKADFGFPTIQAFQALVYYKIMRDHIPFSFS